MKRDRTSRPRPFALLLAGVMLAGFSLPSFAQERSPESFPLHTGSWIISGSAGLASSHTGDNHTTSLHVDPTGLVFVTPSLAIGARVNLGYARNSNNSAYSVGVGPAARFFFSRSSERWFPFIGLAIQPSWTHGKTRGPNPVTNETNSLMIDESIGITRLVATHVGITGELYGNQLTNNNSPGGGQSLTVHSGEAGLRFGLTIFVH